MRTVTEVVLNLPNLPFMTCYESEVIPNVWFSDDTDLCFTLSKSGFNAIKNSSRKKMIVIENNNGIDVVWNPILDGKWEDTKHLYDQLPNGNWKFNMDRAYNYKKNKEFSDDFERKMMWGNRFKKEDENTFSIKVSGGMFFDTGSLICFTNKDEGYYKVLSTPKIHWWQRFKKWMGWNYKWYYKVRKV